MGRLTEAMACRGFSSSELMKLKSKIHSVDFERLIDSLYGVGKKKLSKTKKQEISIILKIK